MRNITKLLAIPLMIIPFLGCGEKKESAREDLQVQREYEKKVNEVCNGHIPPFDIYALSRPHSMFGFFGEDWDTRFSYNLLRQEYYEAHKNNKRIKGK